MGQRQTQQHKEPVTLEQVEQSIKTIFEDQLTKFQPIQIAIPIQRILQNLSDNIPAQKTEEGFVINTKMIQIFYHKGFMFSMGKLINLLVDKLEEIMQRTLIMVQKDEWLFCLNLSNFIVFFTDDKLIRMIETVSIRSDLSPGTSKFIEKLEQQGNQFTATQSLIDKLSFSEIQRIEKCLRISLNQMITMRTQIITRSAQTLKVIQKLEQACLILYMKAIYSPQHSQSILSKAKHSQFLKSNLTIGQYFLGKGSDNCIASIYESAVLLLFNLIQKNKHLRQFKALPTHLFKNLPIVSQNTVYDFIVNVCLYSLTYIKQGNSVYSRFAFNRLMTLKLLDLVVKEVKVSSPQITYYLEEVCLQTKIGMIERSFVTDLVQNYVNLVQETLQFNKSHPVKASVSSSRIRPSEQRELKYSKQVQFSQILTKYLESGRQNYNIQYSNKKWKITTVDIITQLQNDQNIIQTEFRILCEKYIYEVILAKKILYQYNDRQIWCEILPHIIEDKCNTSDDDIQEENKQSQNSEHKSTLKREQPQQQDTNYQLQATQQQQLPNQAKEIPEQQELQQIQKDKQMQRQQKFQDPIQHQSKSDQQNISEPEQDE